MSEARKEIRRVTLAGMGINFLLAGMKGAAGWLSGSQALIADAVHSFSDLSTDLAVLLGADFWDRPPDQSHPYGHGRVETMIGLGIGLLLAGVACGLIWNSVSTLPEAGPCVPGWLAFFAALFSVAVKEWLFRWTAAVGRKIKSSALSANAWHHRSDALSSVPVLISVVWARFLPGAEYVDRVAAVIVSVLLLKAAWDIGWPKLKELSEAGACEDCCRRFTETVLATEKVQGVHALRTRRIGAGLLVDLHVLVDGNMSVREGHDIAGAVKKRLTECEDEVVDVLVHIEPAE